jgi:hypothetical protein
MKNKLEIKAINKDYQTLINNWIDRQYNYIYLKKKKYRDIFKVHISKAYSNIIDIENQLPKRELTNAKKELKKFLTFNYGTALYEHVYK